MISWRPRWESVCCGLPPDEEDDDDLIALFELSCLWVAPPFFGRLPVGLIGGSVTEAMPRFQPLFLLFFFFPVLSFFSLVFFLAFRPQRTSELHVRKKWYDCLSFFLLFASWVFVFVLMIKGRGFFLGYLGKWFIHPSSTSSLMTSVLHFPIFHGQFFFFFFSLQFRVFVALPIIKEWSSFLPLFPSFHY